MFLIVMQNTIPDNQQWITYCIFVFLIIFYLIFEYKFFDKMLFTQLIQDISDRQQNGSSYKYFREKYFYSGLITNSFYFIATLGLNYMPKLVNFRIFFVEQRLRIIMSVVLQVIVVLWQLMVDTWVISSNSIIYWTILTVFHGLTFVYINHCFNKQIA